MGEREKGHSKTQNNGRKNCIDTHIPSGEELKKKKKRDNFTRTGYSNELT